MQSITIMSDVIGFIQIDPNMYHSIILYCIAQYIYIYIEINIIASMDPRGFDT